MQTFSNINEVSFSINFIDDLWQAGERICVFFPGQYGYIGISAMHEGSNFPNTHYTLTTGYWPDLLNSLSDGSTDFYIEMQTGSVKIDSMSFSVSTVPVPSAALLLGSGLVGLAGTRLRSKKK
jgi:hypothetical protein